MNLEAKGRCDVGHVEGRCKSLSRSRGYRVRGVYAIVLEVGVLYCW